MLRGKQCPRLCQLNPAYFSSRRLFVFNLRYPLMSCTPRQSAGHLTWAELLTRLLTSDFNLQQQILRPLHPFISFIHRKAVISSYHCENSQNVGHFNFVRLKAHFKQQATKVASGKRYGFRYAPGFFSIVAWSRPGNL